MKFAFDLLISACYEEIEKVIFKSVQQVTVTK